MGPAERIPDIVRVLREHTAKTKPIRGRWVMAYGYDPSALKEARDLTCDDLDAAFPDNPLRVDASAIRDIKVVETFKEGRSVFRRDSSH
jgi:predicted amidohydrolase YtcJ